MKPPRSNSDYVADSQERLRQRGGGLFPNLTLSPEEMDRWRRLVAAHGGGGRGEHKRTLMTLMDTQDAQDARKRGK